MRLRTVVIALPSCCSLFPESKRDSRPALPETAHREHPGARCERRGRCVPSG